MTTMSASPSNRIQCYRCGHIFDHALNLRSHCVCDECSNTISIPDGRRTYVYGIARAAAPATQPVRQAGPLIRRCRPFAATPPASHCRSRSRKSNRQRSRVLRLTISLKSPAA
jgi:hypothetical protein